MCLLIKQNNASQKSGTKNGVQIKWVLLQRPYLVAVRPQLLLRATHVSLNIIMVA